MTMPIVDTRGRKLYTATQRGKLEGKGVDAKDCGQMNQEVKLGYNEKLPATYSTIQAETEAENETSHNESQIREGRIGQRIVHETSHKTYTREIRYSWNNASPS